MSMLSGLSSYVEQEGQLLQELNDAVLSIQAAAVGDLGLFNMSENDVQKASEVLLTFLRELKQALKSPSNDPTIFLLVEGMRQESGYSLNDWESDIQDLIGILETGKMSGSPRTLQVLENIMNVLNEDYSAAVKSLYFRYQ